MRLVADIGGTNARLALSRGGHVLPETVRSFRNDDFTSFVSVAHSYLAGTAAPDLDEIVVAVAGPVWGRQAKLTNRDWRFETEEIADGLNIAKAALINDLNALGHALPALQPAQLLPIFEAKDVVGARSQSLVIGIGTGFNVCPVLALGERVECLEVEFGHVSLPTGVAAVASQTMGDLSEVFPTVEECFSGRGYQRFLRDGGTVELYAALIGALSRDLMMAFMPWAGLYFNGGVARSVLTSPTARDEFVRVFGQPYTLAPDLDAPVALINDDAAALIGCARVSI